MTKLDIQPARATAVHMAGSQAVRLPKAFRFEGAEVTVRREGDKVISIRSGLPPTPTPAGMAAFWARLDGLDGRGLPAARNLQPDPRDDLEPASRPFDTCIIVDIPRASATLASGFACCSRTRRRCILVPWFSMS